MSLAQEYLDRWLMLDIEHYFRGGLPSPVELARAALLENWRVVLSCELTGKPSYLAGDMSLIGHAKGHPKHVDGKLITTATLVWLDRRAKWARTRDIIWRLGDRSAPPSGADELRKLIGEA
jgi:hypothetical protein